MKNYTFGDIVIGVGTIYFILRSVVSTVSTDEIFTRDIFGFPILEPALEVSTDIWLMSLVGAVIPFVFIFIGMGINKRNKKGSL